MSVAHEQMSEQVPVEAAIEALLYKLRTDRKLLSSVIMGDDLKRTLAAAGYILPQPIFVRLENAVKRIRDNIADQLHVFELKAMQVIKGLANSNNGIYW